MNVNIKAPQVLQYEEVIRGISYGKIGKKTKQRTTRQEEAETNSDDEEMTEAVERQLDDMRNMEKSIRLGEMTKSRPDQVFRLMAGNVNNMANKSVRQRKVCEIQQLIDQWDIQGVGISEVGIDFRKVSYDKNMASWFRANREKYRTSIAHNTRDPAVSVSQPGGIGLIACKELKQYIKDSRGDFRKLGRWNSWIIGQNPEHRTRMVVAYQVAKTTSKRAQNTIVLQHRRYCQHNGINLSPRELFQQDFMTCVNSWLASGERLIIFMDFNEHVLRGKLPRLLQQAGLEEVSHTRWGGMEPKTFARGSQPIDGIYISQELEVTSIMILPFDESIGDHRTMLIDISTRSTVGVYQYKIIRPEARRLTTRNKKALDKYLTYVKQQFKRHNLSNKLAALEQDFAKGRSRASHRKRANAIDNTKINILSKGEKQCRKVTRETNLPFSPKIQRIYRLKIAYENLQRWVEGRSNNSHIIKAAWKAGINNPRQMTAKKCIVGAAICRKQMRSEEKKAVSLRSDYLRERLLLANREGNAEKKKAIQQIQVNEKSKREWSRIKLAIGKPNSGAITKVQKVINGNIVDITSVDEMNAEIQEASRGRFTLALQAPIQQSSLKERVGTCGETEFARQLLMDNTNIPPDVDGATRSLIEEMAELWDKMRDKHVEPTITEANYKGHYRRMKESTSSALSKIHLGHWIAFLQAQELMEFECRTLTLIARSGIPPDRWSKGLQVMLEKTEGVSLVDKLRFILLIEGDKNAYNRMLIGYKAIRDLEEINYIPEDQYSQRGCTAEDSKLDNRLTLDISRQMIINMTAISADADKCYDRINHIVLALALRAVCGEPGIAKAMLEAIQNMKYYQRTGRGDSNTYLASVEELLQGICQGNTAGPACWLILSSIMIRCYEKAGHGSKITSPISALPINFMGEIFVDDTDLLNILMEIQTIEELMEITQANFDEWSRLLRGTGGALNRDKCYWYLIAYTNKEGVWDYNDSLKFNLTLESHSGDRQVIEQLPTSEPRKMLGVWSNPRGNDDKHILEVVVGKTKSFLIQVKNGHLPTYLVWKAYRSCLIPALKYGLSTLATPLAVTIDTLRKYEFELLSYLGVNKHVRTEWRSIPRELGGVGLWNFTVEQCISWLEALLQHYGTNSTIAKKMLASLESLQLEIGCAGNPLAENYQMRGGLATSCWMKAVWERIHYYDIGLILSYDKLPMPRERDCEIVNMIVQHEKSLEIQLSLNRVRMKLQVMFLSCITTFRGNQISNEHLYPQDEDNLMSTYRFPKQVPTSRDWVRWRNFWHKIYPTNLLLPIPLGKWKVPSHRLWKWVLDTKRDILYCQTMTRVEYYTRVSYSTTRSGGSFARVGRVDYLPYDGTPVDAQPTALCNFDGVTVRSGGEPFPIQPKCSTSFWQALETQGGSWMWERMTGDTEDVSWMATALTKGTLLMAADGSYNPNKSTLISGAGWIICCSRSGMRIQGQAYEKSTSAGSYRGEMLGLLALYAIIATVHEYFKLTETSGVIIGDNQGALGQAHQKKKRVTPSEKQTDIIRAIRAAKHHSQGAKLEKRWVKSHVDDLKQWKELTIEEQLNTICDELAKAAVREGTEDRRLTSSRLLPYESAAIVINGEKLTDGMSKELQYQVALADAKHLYTKSIIKNDRGVNIGGLGWDSDVFESVDWKARKRAGLSEMRSLWLCKHEIGVSRTRKNNARIMRTADDKCPNCEQLNEDSEHLNICPDAGRSRLHREGATKLRRWMTKSRSKTEPTMARVLHDYIRLRNSTTMEALASRGSTELREAARMQDRIGWFELMNGKIAIQLVRFQEQYCLTNNEGLNGKSWASSMVRQLLDMSHAQWLYRNFSLHHQTLGYLHRLEEKNLRETARELASLRPEEVPKSSQYLLDIDIESEESFTSVSYWVLAMKAALKEKAINEMRDRQQKRKDVIYGRNWTPIMTAQAAAVTGKRDHSSMVASPILPNPKRPGAGTNENCKRWTQQVITMYTGGNINKPSNRQRFKNSCKIIIYGTDTTSRTNKRRRRNNE